MTAEQFDSLYYGRAVHCDTEEKAKEFLALAYSAGYKWAWDARATEFTKWQTFKGDTHYFVKNFLWNGASIECGNGDYYLKYGIDCVEFIPQNQKETTKTLINEIRAKWSEINILLNKLETKDQK